MADLKDQKARWAASVYGKAKSKGGERKESGHEEGDRLGGCTNAGGQGIHGDRQPEPKRQRRPDRDPGDVPPRDRQGLADPHGQHRNGAAIESFDGEGDLLAFAF